MRSTAIFSFIVASLARTTYAQNNDFTDDFYGDNFESAFQNFDVGKARLDRKAHAVLAAFSFIMLLPVGAFIVRWESPHCWIVHAVTQCIAYIIYIAAAVLGIKLVDTIRLRPDGASLFYYAHPILGIILLAVLSSQFVLGYLHHLRFKRLQRRTRILQVHIWLGRAAALLGIANGYLGMELAATSGDAHLLYNTGVVMALLVWVIVIIVCAVERRRKRKEAASRLAAAVAAAVAAAAAAEALVEQQRLRRLRQRPSVPPRVTRPSRLPPRAQRTFRPYIRNTDADDPTPPYSLEPEDEPPVYRETVEMTPMKNSEHARAPPPSYSPERETDGGPA
ncbi:hypothetical protein F4820DRAFT_452749 [Hypoxylon rubiginosum]|uniref:Uncharacterized protein n=1 Tax=Hypoxylon rubiginosum TaxID=110542 RepID=A0ACB9YML4_9PEZI|nr:hypothetical protein F4820DRAFT_452749 [Hypoxylon rubiginosum]